MQPFACRLSTVCLACKRLRRLCLAPQLLRSIQLQATELRVELCVAVSQSLQHFLERHAQHVRHLTLRLRYSHISEEMKQHSPPLGAAVAGCVAACAAASSGGGSGGLEQLVLSAETDAAQVDLARWLPGMTRLQALWIGRDSGALALPLAISQLSALRELGLRASAFGVRADFLLPASLTRLHVCGPWVPDLLRHQVRSLARLLWGVEGRVVSSCAQQLRTDDSCAQWCFTHHTALASLAQ